ncbi:M56 family metallopeptidase [Frankia sp. AgB32]|uniref:M56 family metallopeptidase n=1 Tax=Frankia sp. AgB32 TaxID=631119 RepID=UPI00200DB5A1|nr:M56 family metallopeptidase [Frankia sp. AgB32]MCK9894926.1 M56 family metallopeptidase [Frankia sp. AgB32]
MVWIPLVVSVAIAVAAPAAALRTPPWARPAALTGGAVLAATGWLWSLALLAASLAQRLPGLARGLDLRVPPRPAVDLPPSTVGAVAAGAVVVAVLTLVAVVARLARDLLRAERMVRRLPDGRVHVVAHRLPNAYAVGGVTDGRVVVTTAMLACLDTDERAAVLAHEQAHLAGRHHWLRMVVDCCAAVDPLLRHLPRLVDAACERWADERAVRTTGQRVVLARALGKAALATLRAPRPGRPAAETVARASRTVTGLDHGSVAERIAALLDGPPRPDRIPVPLAVLSLTLAVVSIGSAVHASADCLAPFR